MKRSASVVTIAVLVAGGFGAARQRNRPRFLIAAPSRSRPSRATTRICHIR